MAPAPTEAITDEEIDWIIEADEQVEDAREVQQMSALRGELNEFKGKAKDKESK